MFVKVLIANRGAIAVRICRTLKNLGVTSVAIYSEIDTDSLHNKAADESYTLGDGNVQETYLNQQKIIEIAKQSGAEAIHPGYGFLSENADFARLCEKNNVAFLGPKAEQIEVFGLKHTARDLAKKSKVPLLPGTDLLSSVEEAINAANNIGYPVMLKSTAGGGGIGMQLCYDQAGLVEAFDSVKRLSSNNFDNDNVFLEKFVESARHIEVQVFGDGKGHAIALGERDCSSQRRHQKVIEETPAPNLPETVRQQLHQLAQQLLASINYRSAGTVEYIYDQQTEAFYFLEVNTRLQVEHGVTEEVFDVDLVEWMVKLGDGSLPDLKHLSEGLQVKGHAIQVRLYAENPQQNFQPSTGLLGEVVFPNTDNKSLRIDHWIEAGIEVSAFFDPMLAKVVCRGETREEAIDLLLSALKQTSIYGVETNNQYVQSIIELTIFQQGKMTTRFLSDHSTTSHTVNVLQAGTLTTLQDYPGRVGYWDIGVPPSGPFDSVSMRLANKLLGNPENAAALEITLNGPSLQFNKDSQFVICGADFEITIDDQPINLWQVHPIQKGQILKINKVKDCGSRCYLAVAGGWQCPDYLGSKSTFTLGQFGGHVGRALRVGDVLHLNETTVSLDNKSSSVIADEYRPKIDKHWQVRVIYGPHGAPDFFTEQDIETFFYAKWEVHYNSSRTGIRLIGPKPDWARSDGGEAGMHPSNIHDNAYAIGTIDFTGDMPVILGPDGPSLGGFVCPATVIQADLWKLGQLKVGDKIEFIPIALEDAVVLEADQIKAIESLGFNEKDVNTTTFDTPVLDKFLKHDSNLDVVFRPSGDHYLLVEYGDLVLDIQLRFRVHALMLRIEKNKVNGVLELTPGVRSLQIHYNSQIISVYQLIDLVKTAENDLSDYEKTKVPARIIHLPLSWDDKACQQAIEKYQQSVRRDAPWYPSNLEFIRRINGLGSIDEVKKIVFDAHYLVMGLGDVYLGAPLATPLDPRHRLVTTKYNPARTWTAENSVGIGGSYMCIYGMEGPGGYQFIGRTLQMWNRYRQTKEFEKPWLLRFFDQIRFYEVSNEDLEKIRASFPKGDYPLKIENTTFSLQDYQQFLETHNTSIQQFTQKRQMAFDEELKNWQESGQLNFEVEKEDVIFEANELIGENEVEVNSHVAGSVWQILVNTNDHVEVGQTLLIIESMKMEIEIVSPIAGTVKRQLVQEGKQIQTGQQLFIIAQ
jgi:urea carboxylase